MVPKVLKSFLRRMVTHGLGFGVQGGKPPSIPTFGGSRLSWTEISFCVPKPCLWIPATSLEKGVSQNWGYLFEGPNNKDYSILVSILGFPYFEKLP